MVMSMKVKVIVVLGLVLLLSAHGMQPEQWQRLHEKLTKKAKLSKTREKKDESSPSPAPAPSISSSPYSSQASSGELLDSIPIRLDFHDGVKEVEFKLFNRQSPVAQAKRFCQQYDLNQETCQVLISRAEELFVERGGKLLEGSPAETGRRVSQPSSITSDAPISTGNGRVLETISIIIEDGGETFEVPFRIYDNATPHAQAKEFCHNFQLTEEYCAVLIQRAESVYAEKLKNPPTANVDTTVKGSSVASKLAKILSEKRRKQQPSEPILPKEPTAPLSETVGHILDSIPIVMDYKNEKINVQFDVYDNADPQVQAKAFCEKYQLNEEYCRILIDRAESVFAKASTKSPLVNDASSSSRTAEIMSNPRKTSKILTSFPIILDLESGRKEIEFKIYDDVEPLKQIEEFCGEHNLQDGHCQAVRTRATELLKSEMHSNSNFESQHSGSSTTASAVVSGERRVLTTIPTTVNDGKNEFAVPFKIYDDSDPLIQAKSFCNTYGLTEEHCSALTSHAETVLAKANFEGSKHSMSASDTNVLLGTVPIRLEKLNEVVDIDFKLFSYPGPVDQAKQFCREYDLSQAYCEALTERAIDMYEHGKASSQVSSTTSGEDEVLDIIPIRLEHEGNVVDLDFKVLLRADPEEEARKFCVQYDLMEEYCEAVKARARYIYDKETSLIGSKGRN